MMAIPHRHDRPDRRKKRVTVGFLTSEIHHDWALWPWLGMVDTACRHEVNLLTFVGNAVGLAQHFREQGNVLYALVDAERLDGLIIWSAPLLLFLSVPERETFCQGFGLPIVTLEEQIDGFPCVTYSNYEGMRLVIDHLLDVHGYRRIGFAGMYQHHSGFQERYRAYVDALQAHGLAVDPELVQPWFPDEIIQEEAKIREDVFTAFLKRAIAAGVEAFVGVCDTTAIQIVKSVQALGYAIPQDLAVVGFDNFTESRVLTPPLTTLNPSLYEMGYQAVHTLVESLEGKPVEERRSVPPRLMIRQSCGCADATVARAWIDSDQSTIQRDFNRQEMTKALAQSFKEIAIQEDPQPLDALAANFVSELTGEQTHVFLPALETMLRETMRAEGNAAAWQNAISTLRQCAFPWLVDRDMAMRAENIWQQARVVLGNLAERKQAYQRIRGEQHADLVRDVGQLLITTFDIKALMDILAESLPRLGIRSCYLSLYETPQPYAYPAPAPEWSRLMLAYNQRGRVTLEPDGQRFPSRQLCPLTLFPSDELASFVVEPLYFQEHQLGFGLFEASRREGNLYEILRGEISSALRGALLVQHVQNSAAELARKNTALEEAQQELAVAYEEIRIMNEHLKEDNLRMGAELDVARRLQTMVLPPPEELRQIEGLEIVGYMQPADEVGGDYYDVVCHNGTVHIGIGDVTGHGLESGVLMLMTQTAVRTLIEHGETDPKMFLTTLNRIIIKNVQRMQADKTLTLAFVTYREGRVTIVGQHEYLLVIRQGGHIERIDTCDLGFPLGLEEDIAHWVDELTIDLQPGDSIVLYTDGITEAENHAREFYGLDRLCAVLSRHWDQPAEVIKQAVIADVTRHIGDQKVFDDVTLVVLRQQSWRNDPCE